MVHKPGAPYPCLQVRQIPLFFRPLRAADNPALPSAHVAQKSQGVEQQSVPLPRLQAAHLNDDHRVRVGSEFGANAATILLPILARCIRDRAQHHLRRRARKKMKVVARPLAVRDHEIRPSPARPAVKPVVAAGRSVSPKRQRNADAPRHGSENRVVPRAVANHHVRTCTSQHAGKNAPNAPDRPGPADACRPEQMDWRPGLTEFLRQRPSKQRAKLGSISGQTSRNRASVAISASMPPYRFPLFT